MTLFLRISLIVLIFSITPLKNSFANWITKKSDKEFDLMNEDKVILSDKDMKLK